MESILISINVEDSSTQILIGVLFTPTHLIAGKNTMKHYFLILILFISAHSSASSCIKLENINALDDSFEFSFIGNIVEKINDFSLTKEKFLIKVKASNHEDISDKVIIWTTNPSNCGASFEVGKDYVIFAKKYKGKIMTYYDSSWMISEKTEEITGEYIEYYRAKGMLTWPATDGHSR